MFGMNREWRPAPGAAERTTVRVGPGLDSVLRAFASLRPWVELGSCSSGENAGARRPQGAARERSRSRSWRRIFQRILTTVIFASVSLHAAPSLNWEPIDGGRRARLSVPSTGGPGFTEMQAATTGIRFTNALDDRRIVENNNFMEGSGVALGDYDGDGWCDLYFCGIGGTNVLYRNLGAWKFADVTVQAGVNGAGWASTGAVFADVDGDGDLDLIVSSLGQGVHCLRNEGKGQFQDVTAAAGLTSRTGSLGLALGDIDGDGDLDLYVANYGAQAILRGGGRADLKQVNGKWEVTGPYADRLRVVDGRLEEVGEVDVLYRNDGRGRFEAVPWNSTWFRDEQGQPMPPPWDFGLGVQIRDINEDGFPDIYVCNDFQTVDRIWINDGRGQFRLLSKLAVRQQSYASMGVDFADIDRDGHLDFFVAEMMSRDRGRRLRQVLGFQPVHSQPGFFDNRPEVARNTLFWNRGDGTYAEIAQFAGVQASDWSWQPVFLDVDLDGYEDVLVANGNAFDVQDRDVLARVRAMGRLTPEQSRTNLLLYPRFDSPNAAFRNRGNRTFEAAGDTWHFNSRRISHGIALADLDHDGDQDVVINTLNDSPLLYRNDGSAPRVMVRLRGQSPNGQGIGAKVRLRGGAVPWQSQEIVCGGRYLAGDDPARAFAAARSNPALPMQLEVVWRSGRHSIVRDVEPNFVYEISEASAKEREPSPPASLQPVFVEVSGSSSGFQHFHREELFDDYQRQPLLHRQYSSLGPGVGWMDLNGDGHLDLAIGAGKGGQLAVFAGNGQGKFSRLAVAGAPLADDTAGLAAWVTARGERRLLTALSGYESTPSAGLQLLAWQIGSDGRLTNSVVASLPGNPSSPGPVAVADYDGDGDLDVFVGGRIRPGAYPFPPTSALLMQQDGRLSLDATNAPGLSEVGMVSGAVWTDLDDDGWPELVLACEWGPIRVFRNRHGHFSEATRELGLADQTGWWTSVAAVDVDGDGRMDLVAGNWGLNSPYRASLAQPAQFFYGEIGGRGVTDLLEAEFDPEQGIVAPRRSLGVLSHSIPSLLEHYPSHRSFSAASAAEIFQRLHYQPSEVRASTLASTVFLNRGSRFEPVPLPDEAQWCPVFGVAAADFDGDGRQDLLLAQNFFAVRPDISRQDAGQGLLLRGLGGASFSPMAGQVSGVNVNGEQRGLAVGDFDRDGRPDLVISQNGAQTRLFRNRAGSPGLRVRLQGMPGNPDGIGATVRLRGKSGLGPLVELHAGSGYWSQDGVEPVVTAAALPMSVLVRWPGGGTAEIPVSPGAAEVVVRAADSSIQR